MATIPGASGFLNSATLANSRGLAPSINSLLSNNTSTLLDAGRRINRSGIGISNSARAANRAFIESIQSESNALFSLTIGQTNSIEGATTAIAALRASTPQSGLARSLRDVDDGGISSSPTGQEIDTEA